MPRRSTCGPRSRNFAGSQRLPEVRGLDDVVVDADDLGDLGRHLAPHFWSGSGPVGAGQADLTTRQIVDSARGSAVLGNRRRVQGRAPRLARGDAPHPCAGTRRATRGPNGGSGTPTGSGACSTPGTRGCTGRSEYGGRGASPTEQLIFYEETTRAKAPYVGVNFVGTLHAGPTLIEEGTDEQKAAHLPRSSAATRCGARASPSRARAPTSRRCARAPIATATTTC